MITRVSDGQWHALADDLVVGRGDAVLRPDDRLFVSIDAWHDPVFDRLAAAMLAELPGPLHTMADADDPATVAGWQRAGFAVRRRERTYTLVPAEVPAAPPVAGVTFTADGDGFRAEAGGPEAGTVRFLAMMKDNGKPRIARIVHLEVGARWRRRGIGRALLSHALNDLHARGFTIASADVDDTDTAAVRLLESAGARLESTALELTWPN